MMRRSSTSLTTVTTRTLMQILSIVINPYRSRGVFESTGGAQKFKELHTKYASRHDILLKSLDVSGQNLAIGTKERRALCFTNFIGPKGRVKDIGLFVCFLIWEGVQTKFHSRRLDDTVARAIGISSTNEHVTDTEFRTQGDKFGLVSGPGHPRGAWGPGPRPISEPGGPRQPDTGVLGASTYLVMSWTC